MRLTPGLFTTLMLVSCAATPPSPMEVAMIFAPGTVAGATSDSTITFSPDGKVAYFGRSQDGHNYIMRTVFRDGRWSSPAIASFSGTWLDLEPSMAPDGSYLLFTSNRPDKGATRPIDGFYYGKEQIAKGGNIWRVDRVTNGWSEPYRLPSTVNASTSIYEPAAARSGAIYFQQIDAASGQFRLRVSRPRAGGFAPSETINLGDDAHSDMDPAIAPDESYMIFSSDRSSDKRPRLYISYRAGKTWAAPVLLADNVNACGRLGDPRLSQDGKRLYFTSSRRAKVSDGVGFNPVACNAPGNAENSSTWDNGKGHIWSVSLKSLGIPRAS
jgi:Tol biopolymer transport system component